LRRRQSSIISGWMNRFGVAMGRFTPRSLLLRAIGSVMRNAGRAPQ
jgi:hypothetical protein